MVIRIGKWVVEQTRSYSHSRLMIQALLLIKIRLLVA